MQPGAGGYPQNPTLRVISNRARRRIAAELIDRDVPTSMDEICTPAGAPGGTSRHRADLVHRHLPALDAAGLVDWNRAEETVETAAHPAFDDPRFRTLLTTEVEGLDAVLSGLAHEHRRIVLTELTGAAAWVPSRDLAGAIYEQERLITGRQPPAVDDLVVSLHHHHLPKLANDGLLEYDPVAERATDSGHPGLAVVLQIVYDPGTDLVDRLDAFMGGLNASYARSTPDLADPFAWPQLWRDPSHG